MSKYLSNRQKNLRIGISSYTESNTVLEVTGKVGIGTTNAHQQSLYVVGDGYFSGDLRVSGVATFGNNTVIIDGDNNIVKVGTAITLSSVDGITTPQLNISGGLSAQTINVSGASTLASNGGITTTGGDLYGNRDVYVGRNLIVSGLSTFSGIGTFGSNLYVQNQLYVGGISITGGASIGEDISTRNIFASGITTFTGITTSLSTIFGKQLSLSGIATLSSLNIGDTQVISSGRQLQNIASLDAVTTATIETAIANAPNTFTDLIVTGISTLGVTSATNLTSQQLNVSGVSTFAGITTVTGTTLFAKQLNVSGVSTLAGKIVSGNGIGNTNLANTLNYSASTGITAFRPISLVDSAAGIKISRTGGQTLGAALELQTWDVGIVTNYSYWDVNAQSGYFGIRDVKNSRSRIFIDDSGSILLGATSSNFTTNYNQLVGVGTDKLLNVLGNSYISGSVGIGTTNSTSKLSVVGDGNFTGVVTATTFIGNLTGIAASATQLVTPRTFEITGDIVASPISFNGTGNVSLAATIQPNSVALGGDTTGDYVQTISGTSNQITVTGGTGEGSTPTLSIPSQFTAPQDVTVTRDLQVNRNLNVNGNITIGGTTAFINVQELKVTDPDLVLGFRTDAFGNDVSNDTTANHGGIAIASTEGSPLVSLYNPGIGESTVSTYKKIMWFKAGSFSGLGTDAWLINYAVGIGSTQFPVGTRLAAGNVQFTQNDLAVVRHINASGIVTASTFTGSLANTLTLNTSGTGLSGSATFNNSGAATFTVTSNATSANTVSTIVSRDALGGFSAGIITATSFIGGISSFTSLNVSGISTVGVLSATSVNATGIITASSFRPSSGYIQAADGTNSFYIYNTNGNVAFQGTIGVSQINSGQGYPALNFTSTTTPTVLVRNDLGVSGIATIFGNVGLGTTNPTSRLTVSGDGLFTGVVTATTFSGQINAGVSTLGIATATNLTTQQLNVSGITTTNSLNIGATQVISSARQLQNIASLDAVTTSTIESAISNAPNDFTSLNVSGISTLGVTSATNLTVQQLSVSGLSTFSGIATHTAAIFGTTASFTGIVTALSFSGNASSATYATTAGIATSVIGGIGSITQLQVTGVSTFTNGPVLIGSATSTGTASQRLQVTGGAYVSGSVGVGTTNPAENLHILGNLLVAAGSSTGQHITQKAYELNNGTLSWEGSTGQLFSITNNLTSGSIFSVNDVSGIPSVDVNADGTVTLAPYADGNVGIATTRPTSRLHVVGNGLFTGIVTAASFSGNASSATYATTAGIATYATTAGIATYATTAGIATYATTAGIATYATTAGIATYATSAGISTYATTSGVSTSVIGGIASVTQLSVSGISTLGITSATNLTAQQLNVSGITTVGFITATNIWNAGITTSSRLTLNGANDTTTGGGQIYLNGTTGNRIDFNTNGVGAPTFTTRSAGTKIVLYPIVGGSTVDYAFGIQSGTLWYSIPEFVSAYQFRWYGGQTQLADLKGTGEFLLGSSTLTGTANQTLQVTGGAYVSGNLGIGTTNPGAKLDVVGRAQIGGIGISNALYVKRVTDNTVGVTFGYPSTTTTTELSLRHNAGGGYFTIHLNGTGGEQGNGFNEKFRFTDEGRIGIGRSIPSIELDVFGGGNFTNRVLIGSATSTNTVSQTLQVTGGAYVSGNLGIGNTNPQDTVDVGLGTIRLYNKSSPTRFSQIYQDGALNFKNSVLGDDFIFYGASNLLMRLNGSGELVVGSSNLTGTASQRLQVTGGAYVSGSVGVGTTNPAENLHIYGRGRYQNTTNNLTALIDAAVNGPRVSFGSNGDNSLMEFGSYSNLNNLDTKARDLRIFSTAAPNAFTLQQSTGNIGINSTSPTSRLDVVGDGKFTGVVTATTFVGQINAGVGTITTLSGTTATYTTGNITNISGTNLNYTGISTITNLSVTNINSTGIITATQFTTGSGNLGFTTNTISGPSEIIIDPSPVGVGTTSGIVRILGDLYVDGTQFIVNSTTIELADLNVGIATTVGTDALLNGAGIGIGSANIRKTINWNNSLSALSSSENWNIASGKTYKIGGTDVLSSTTLGTNIVNSSLTSVGTLGQLNVSGVTTSSGGFVGNLTGTATTATNLADAANITTGTIAAARLSGTYNININGSATYATTAGIATYATSAGIATYAITAGIATYATTAGVSTSVIGDIASVTQLSVSGISTLGITSATNLTAQQLNISGISTFNNTLSVIPTSTAIAGLFSGTTSSDMVRITQLGTGNALVVEDEANPDANPFVVTGVGTVGIGITNPSIKLTVNGGLDSSNRQVRFVNSGTGDLYIKHANLVSSIEAGSSVQLALGGNGAEVVRINSTGVGIGTTNPTSKFTVSGDGLFTGVVTATTFSGQINAGVSTLGIATATNLISQQLNVSGITTSPTYDTVSTRTGSATSTTTTTSQTAIHTGLSTSSYRSVEYLVQGVQSTNFHTTKILVVHDGTTAYLTEYGTVFNNATVASYDVDISGGNLRLLATPASSSSTTFKINFTTIVV